MPVEIHELVIRAVVEPDPSRRRVAAEEEMAELRRRIVAECLAQLDDRRLDRPRR